MCYFNYKEEESNKTTEKLHELLKINAHDEIIKIYNKIQEKDRTSEQTRCMVASLILLNRMDEARLLLDKWANVGKNDVQWNTQYGWTYYLERKYKEAIKYFDRVEDLDPRDTTMLSYLRECNEEIGNKEEVKRIKNWIKEINTIKETGEKYKKENYYKNKSK